MDITNAAGKGKVIGRIHVSNISRNVFAAILAEGYMWQGDINGQIHWTGNLKIPKNEVYQLSFTGRNETGDTLDIECIMFDDSG